MTYDEYVVLDPDERMKVAIQQMRNIAVAFRYRPFEGETISSDVADVADRAGVSVEVAERVLKAAGAA